jgi:hypothetical protein
MATPETPLRWEDVDLQGQPRKWVRLIYVNLLRAFQQLPPKRHMDQLKDTGYQTLPEYDELRKYIERWAPWRVIEYNDKTTDMWISIPSPDSPNYKTRLTQWNTILRKWPSFIDPELGIQ